MHLSRLELLDLADPEASTPPALVHVGHAVQKPTLTLRLFVERLGFRQATDGWVDEATAVLQAELDPVASTPVESGPRSRLPSFLADQVQLGLRSAPQGRQALLETTDVRRALIEQEPVAGFGPVACVWTLKVSTPGVPDDAFTVIDQGHQQAIWIVRSVTDEQMLLDEVGSLGIWERLSRLLNSGITRDLIEPAEAESVET